MRAELRKRQGDIRCEWGDGVRFNKYLRTEIKMIYVPQQLTIFQSIIHLGSIKKTDE